MRYADGPATRVEVLIAAPPATVWRLVCDIDVLATMPDKEEPIIDRRLAEHLTNMTATVEGIRALAQSSAAGHLAESGR